MLRKVFLMLCVSDQNSDSPCVGSHDCHQVSVNISFKPSHSGLWCSYLSRHKKDQSTACWTADFLGNVWDFHSLPPSPLCAPLKCCEVLLTCFPFTLPWHTCWNPWRDSDRGLVIWYVWDFLPYQPYPTPMSPGEFRTYCPRHLVSI